MTVRELIAALQEMDPNAQVHFAHSAGDYWRTTKAATVTECDVGFVHYSGYHKAAVTCDEVEKGATEVVILQ